MLKYPLLNLLRKSSEYIIHAQRCWLLFCFRQNFQELDKDTQNTIILYYLQAHRRLSVLKDEYGRESKRGSAQYTPASARMNLRISRTNVSLFCDLISCILYCILILSIIPTFSRMYLLAHSHLIRAKKVFRRTGEDKKTQSGNLRGTRSYIIRFEKTT